MLRGTIHLVQLIAGIGLTVCVACHSNAQSVTQRLANGVCKSESTIYPATVQELESCRAEARQLKPEMEQVKGENRQLKAQVLQLQTNLDVSRQELQTLKESSPRMSRSASYITTLSSDECLARTKTSLEKMDLSVGAGTSGTTYFGHSPSCTVLAQCISTGNDSRRVTAYASCIAGKAPATLGESFIGLFKEGLN